MLEVMNDPAKENLYIEEATKRAAVLNGPRPSPLRVNKDSHIIHKPKHSSFHHHHQPPPPPRKQPVIIYTHSPKIIHTKPNDFMALVQKLTGFTRPGHDEMVGDEFASSYPHRQKTEQVNSTTREDNDSSSVTSDENRYGGDGSEVSALNKILKNPFLSDFPLFTPNSSNFFSSSPQPILRYPDVEFTSSPNVVTSLSPSFVEFIKGLPAEY